MLYTIQNPFGEVYGTFKMDDGVSSSALECEQYLRGELSEVPGINRVEASTLVLDSSTGQTADRIIVDIDPVNPVREEKLIGVVHSVVGGLVSLQSPLE